MTTAIQNDRSTFVQPKLNAEQALQSVLALIRMNKHVTEFTPERLNQAFHTEVQYAKDDNSRYGSGEPISPDWSYGFHVNNKVKDLQGKLWSKFVFSFNPVVPDSNPNIGTICTMSFDAFSAELEALGFKRERRYGEHGRWLYDEFNNATMRINMYVENSATVAADERPQNCIKMIEIL
jgi:hypothetical protein